jgi:hypothetical protein
VKALLLAAVGVLLLVNSCWELTYDPFSQRNFPCQEDEVLMFIDTPDKASTGCVHLDSLRAVTELAPTLPPVVLQ